MRKEEENFTPICLKAISKEMYTHTHTPIGYPHTESWLLLVYRCVVVARCSAGDAETPNGISPIDSVGGYMLVSKAKPCMSKFKLLMKSETANGSLQQL